METIQEFITRCMPQYQEDLVSLVTIQSISAQAAHRDDLQKVATRTVELLREAGASAQVLQNDTFPVAVGVITVSDDAPWVTIYNHLDVQPAAEPQWNSNPFEPVLSEEGIQARGATDDKGPMLSIVYAVRYLKETGQLPVNVQFVLESEEESGSKHFGNFLDKYTPILHKPDSILVSDTIFDGDDPAVTFQLRGLTMGIIELKVGEAGVHSGILGGLARNPLATLTRAIATCIDDGGKVLVPGFYDGVQAPTEQEKRIIDEVAARKNFGRIRSDTGFEEFYTEDPREAEMRTNYLPTLEIHGYEPEASGTKISGYAKAHFSMRLVAGQDPSDLGRKLQDHLRRTHPKITVHIAEGSTAVKTDLDNPFMERARQAYVPAFGRPAVFVATGGTIGAFPPMQRTWPGVPIVMLAQSLMSDGYHAPNENFKWQQARRGIETIATYLRSIGDLKTA
ncbi:M20/M25/M40 family metallo-hydrolase [Candidatus Woesearchaeota archaeon]|nr:M20/M25/M40 family metallo-hydrolase [Candidatus Woesearchaeota archaeon]